MPLPETGTDREKCHLNLGALVGLRLKVGTPGRVDLYQAFAGAMIEALRPCGAVGLLCSNKFLTNRTGKSMRGLLHQELVLQELVDLGDTKLFDAAVLPVIVSGTRRLDSGGAEHVRFRSVYERTPAPGTRPEATHSILDALSSDISGFVTDGDRTFLRWTNHRPTVVDKHQVPPLSRTYR